MPFYSSIAPWYDRIFPFDREILPFLSLDALPPGGHVLDIGCATGKLCRALSRKGFQATGIDLDPELIALAEGERAPAARARGKGTCRFFREDMRRVGERFPGETFHLITCLGNTLVHLEDADDTGRFFAAVHGLLADGGIFAGQIINYDRILGNQCRGLPTIRNRHLTFERVYEYGPSGKGFRFATRLTVKDPARVIENVIPQFPIQSAELTGLLKRAGFSKIGLYANYQKDPFTTESYALIFRAEK